MSDFVKDKWPVLANAAAGTFIAVMVAIQFLPHGDEGRDGADGMAAMPTAAEPMVSDTGQADTDAEMAAEPATQLADVDGARIANADSEPGNWLSHGRTYSEQRYSPLTAIDAENVSQLGLAWSFSTGTVRGLEATPIVVDGRMYTTGNWGVVYALDARTGEEIWSFDPEVPGEWGRYGCCDIVNRGVALWKGRVYVASFDGRLFALNAEDGSVHW